MKTQPSFDAFTIFFLLIGLLGICLTFFLYSNKNRRASSWPIGLITFGFSLILVQYTMFWTGYLKVYPYIFFYDQSWYLAFGPLIYIYIVRFYVKEYKPNLFHFIPAALSLLLFSYYKFTTQHFTDVSLVKTQFLYKLTWRLVEPWLSIVSLFIYLWITIDFIKIRNVENVISDKTLLREKWTRLITHFFGLFIIAFTSYYTLMNFSFFNVSWDYAISISMAIGIYGITYMVFKEPQIFNGELLSRIFMPKKQQEEELKIETKTEFYNQLINYLETKKPYLNNDLRLIHISDELGLPVHLLSQIINEFSQTNFNQLINNYRLIEAEKLLVKDISSNIKDIYFDVGFNNKTTFNKSFKLKFGCTPTQYKNDLLRT